MKPDQTGGNGKGVKQSEMFNYSVYSRLGNNQKCLITMYIVGWVINEGGGVAQWLGRRISDQGVPGSNPRRCTFRCGLEQVTFTLLSTG